MDNTGIQWLLYIYRLAMRFEKEKGFHFDLLREAFLHSLVSFGFSQRRNMPVLPT